MEGMNEMKGMENREREEDGKAQIGPEKTIEMKMEMATAADRKASVKEGKTPICHRAPDLDGSAETAPAADPASIRPKRSAEALPPLRDLKEAPERYGPGRRNQKIEFLRFCFSMSILLFHIQKRFLGGDDSIDDLVFFAHGCIGVEFFFLVSGWLLASSWHRRKDLPLMGLGTETAGVMWKKICSVFPYHLFAMILTIFINGYCLFDTKAERIDYAINSWASVFMLQVFGFQSNWANRLTWYLDVWLMVSFLFYPLGRRSYDVFVKIICPLTALFILGYLDYETGSLSDVREHLGFFYKSFLRGAGEMALGCSAFSLTRRFRQIRFTKLGKFLLGLGELLGYLTVFIYSNLEYEGRYEFPVLLLMFVLIIISFSEVNPGKRLFENRLVTLLGRYSLMIYLNQFYCIRLVQQQMAGYPYREQAAVCVLLTFTASFLCLHLVGALQIWRPWKILFEAPKGPQQHAESVEE